MTKLQAVNEMLEAVKEFPASALDTGGTTIVASAEVTLDRESERVQSYGWHENTDYNVELTPSGGEISAPAYAIAIDSYGQDSWMDICVRDGNLYNKTENTDQFSQAIKTVIVRKLDFVDCSPELQWLIVKTASLTFHRRQIGGQVQNAYLEQELDAAARRMHQANAAMADNNILDIEESTGILGARSRSTIR